MSKYVKNQHGFTIIELMIATAVFSLVLLVCAAAVAHVGRIYYKGIVTSRTQDTARRINQEVSTVAQFTGSSGIRSTGPVTLSGIDTYAYCIGNTRFSYAKDKALGTGLGKSAHVLWKDSHGQTEACIPLDLTQTIPGGADGSELLGPNMRLPIFSVVAANKLVTINLTVTYGDSSDLFIPEDLAAVPAIPAYTICKGLLVGGQFCAVSSINTSVLKRL
ncbi:prepilin-type N-terminal cleavage/methylation domain-containing protein [Candidatus Saccharibacteria bacterium]|nr:prepilin-type N-terminal cleavage/methylation domain-containing protein [Candidatus Saccharibacteria bacterium]